MATLWPLFIYCVPLILIWWVYGRLRRKRQERDAARLFEQQKSGRGEPASLHPVIDAAQCIGCATCVGACPEQNVLGIINARAALVSPSNCIGHGACKAACPVGAIALVFGTATRGVDIPVLKPNFETSVPGIYIAGELGGMGLIRNAVTQGREAMDFIAREAGKASRPEGVVDVVIVGAGPAGFSASLAAMGHGLRYVTLEQETLGGTVAHYPRGKVVMTQPVVLPVIGQVNFREVSKEELLEFWQKAGTKTGVRINYSERVDKIVPGPVLEVRTNKSAYRARAVLLAIGRRGSPRKLGVPGEDMPHVTYHLRDPEEFSGKRVLVVGGGDSALEAAVALSHVAGTKVILSYRGETFSRVKPRNSEAVEQARAGGRIDVVLSSNVLEIQADKIMMDHAGTRRELGIDAVLICAGGVLPTQFLKDIGIVIETKYGQA